MSSEKVREIANTAYLAANYRRLGLSFTPPVQSLTDVDFYMFTMGQWIHKYYPDVEVTLKLTVRDHEIPLLKYLDLDDLRRSFEYAQSLVLRKTDLYFLRGIDLYGKNMFSEEYLSFLRTLKLPSFEISTKDGLSITFKGRWPEVIFWENVGMACISELYYRGVMKDLSEGDVQSVYAVADNRLENNLLEVKKHPEVIFSDFGQRRRHSFLWQKHVVGKAKRALPGQFSGSSNVYMAFHHDVDAKGTFAHAPTMVCTAIAKSIEEMRYAQYDVLKKWQDMHGKGLRIILPDTYGSEQFFANAPTWLLDWTGQRQDSGDPVVEIDRYISWLEEGGVDPKTKISISSDSHTVPSMISVVDHFKGRQTIPIGWGTGLTNDFAGTLPGNQHMRPFSMVVKPHMANGNYCVKLSNDISKATGPKKEIDRYVEIFGAQHRVTREVWS